MPWGAESNRVVPSDWRRRKAAVLRRDRQLCHACSHPGAEQVDHLRNVAAGGGHELPNLAPIHGAPCPTCRRECHKAKTAQESAAARAANRAKSRHPVERHPGLH